MTWSCSWMEGDGMGDAGLGWGQEELEEANGCVRTIGLSPPCSPGCHRPGAAGSRWWWPGTWGCSCWAGAPSSAVRLPGALPSWHPPGRAAGCAAWWWHRTRPTPQGSWDGGRGFMWREQKSWFICLILREWRCILRERRCIFKQNALRGKKPH